MGKPVRRVLLILRINAVKGDKWYENSNSICRGAGVPAL